MGAINSSPCPESSGPRVVALKCAGLCKHYGEVKAVDGLDLAILAGECFGLLGPNGAGKTTTMEMMEGLTAPDRGEVSVLGCSWSRGHERALRERLGVQLQETQLADKFTVEETVRLFRSFYRRGRGVDEVIQMVDLAEKRGARVGKLSGGQKQRLALACALVSDPEVLFLDEPTIGLDPQARVKIWGLVQDFHARGGTIIITTHYMEEASRLCDRVAIMHSGKVIALGSPADLVNSLNAEQILEFIPGGALQEETLGRLPGVSGWSRKNGAYLLTVSNISEALPALMAELTRQAVPLYRLTTRQATLEDVFMSLTGRTLRDGA